MTEVRFKFCLSDRQRRIFFIFKSENGTLSRKNTSASIKQAGIIKEEERWHDEIHVFDEVENIGERASVAEVLVFDLVSSPILYSTAFDGSLLAVTVLS